jgi:hypothetical protein
MMKHPADLTFHQGLQKQKRRGQKKTHDLNHMALHSNHQFDHPCLGRSSSTGKAENFEICHSYCF